MNRTFSDKEIASALQSAPLAVKELIDSEDTLPEFVGNLGHLYQLHLDVIGSIAEMIRDTLLGLLAPADLYNGLIELKVPEQTARRIMEELNTTIVIPLREKLRKGEGMTAFPRPAVPTPSYASPSPSAPKVELPSNGPRQTITIPAPPEAMPCPTLQMPPALSRPAAVPPANLPGVVHPPVLKHDEAPSVQTVSAPAPSQTQKLAAPRTPAVTPPPRVPGTPDPYREPIE